jgi:branched-subunit amino acid aminotransferase/4-amino-4-deoxychorismate lyase
MAFAYKTPTTEELSTAIRSVVDANSLEIGSIRLTLSPRESNGILAKPDSPLNILVSFRYGEPYAAAFYGRGFTATIAKSTRRNEYSPLSRHKTTNFLDNILAKNEAQNLNADEAILLNTAGNIAEGTVTNIFLVKNRQVLTPCIEDGALPGIMRQKVLELCHTQNIPAQETSLTSKDLEHADEAFLTNSLMGVMPLAKVDDYFFDSTKTSVTKELAKVIN